MLKKIVVIILVLSLAVLGFSSFSLADGKFNRNPLDLSEEQQATFKELHEEFNQNIREVSAQLREENLQLRELTLTGGTEEEISQVRQKINLLQNQLLTVRTNFWGSLKEILTPEQLQAIEDLEKDFKAGPTRDKWKQKGGFERRRPARSGRFNCPRF